MSTLTRHLNPIRNMFLLDNQDYDPFKDFFNNFSKALSDDHRLTDVKDLDTKKEKLKLKLMMEPSQLRLKKTGRPAIKTVFPSRTT